MLGASGAETDSAGDRGREDGGGGGETGAAPGWPGGAVGLLLSTAEEALAALDWVLQGGDAALAPPLCQVLYQLPSNLYASAPAHVWLGDCTFETQDHERDSCRRLAGKQAASS